MLVFNLSVISFMLSLLQLTSDSGLSHLSTSVALFMGFCLTLLGLWLFLVSQQWDEIGLSHPWPFALGSMTTFLALSQTITAFMHEYLFNFKLILESINPQDKSITNSLIPVDTATLTLFIIGGIIWFLISYIAPLGLARRCHPIIDGRRWLLAIYYCCIQIPIYWVYAKVWLIQYDSVNQKYTLGELFMLQFIQPLLWWFH